MSNTSIFSNDHVTNKPKIEIIGEEISDYSEVISKDVSIEAVEKGDRFSEEIRERFVADFEKKGIDKMVHVSTFAQINGIIYMTYYANCANETEDPTYQTARLAYCPVDDTDNLTVIDIQSVGDDCYGRRVNLVYDTIFAQIDTEKLIILWTAKVGETYYRLFRYFDIQTKTLSDVGVNRFKVGDIVNDFSTSGIVSALTENGIGCKRMYSDIGIMQKFTSRLENGKKYYYTGTYSGDFNAIIKSCDFVTWEYVSQPDFLNLSKWENAVYLMDDKIFYFVRQHDVSPYGFLTVYYPDTNKWEKPVLVEDCQSRSDFICYKDQLYMIHAPIDREHIGIIKIDTDNIANSKVILQADMKGSCFYPFVQYFDCGELAMSYTVSRRHIRLARFDLHNYL